MSARRRVLLAVLAVAALAALLPVAPASAATYNTKVIVSLKFPAFHGSLKSKRGSCLSDRTVKLFRKKDGAVKLLGTDLSNNKGKWSIPIGKKLPSGSYFAKATARGNCRGGKSQVLPIA